MKLPRMLGWLNPLRGLGGWFERHPWLRLLVTLAPFLLLLALLNPVLGALDKLLAVAGRILGPLLETGVGRAILLVGLLLVLASVVYAFFKERVLDVFRRHALAVHMDATEALLRGDVQRARRGLRRVVRFGRWIDLAKGPATEHGSLAIDARIKLARLWLSRGAVRRARATLARVLQAALRGRLAFSFAEINARVFAAHPDHLPDSVIEVLEASHRAWPGHVGIATLLAGKLVELGRDPRAVEVLEETQRRASKMQTGKAARELARLQRRLAEQALLRGDAPAAGKLLDRSLRLEESEASQMLRVDVLLAKGELESALGLLAATPTPAAKERLGRLLRHEAEPVTARQLLRRVPRQDVLLLLAERWLETGDLRRAARALRIALRFGPRNPRSLALLACIKLREDGASEAGVALKQALSLLPSG
jgi:thioredoxin-like negative regulator of GroEL